MPTIIRVKPTLSKSGSKGKVVKRWPLIGAKNVPIIFSRLTIVWVQFNGVPFDTTGFNASLTRRGRVVATTPFDRFGVARFNSIRTLTSVSFRLQAFDDNGVVFRTRIIPAGVEVFAIIG